MKQDCDHWLRIVMKSLSSGTNHPNAVTPNSLSNQRQMTRDVMAQRLSEILKIVYIQMDYVAHLEGELQQLKSDTIEKQERVIKLQDELITAKEGQLVELRDTVVSSVSSVSDTVKTQFQSYSEALQGAETLTGNTLLDHNTLKTVVKDVVAEEDRSRNLVIFGLPEEPAEQITDKVNKVLEVLGEKPKIEAVRIGLKAKEQTPRPVKVSVSNSTIVSQVLSKSKNLRNSHQYKKVFISPDRTPDQRAAHRKLIEQLKAKRAEEQNKHHYIKGGQIFTVEKR